MDMVRELSGSSATSNSIPYDDPHDHHSTSLDSMASDGQFNHTHHHLHNSSDFLNFLNDEVHHGHSQTSLLAPMVLLLIGAGLRATTKRWRIPYTMQLLILGFILGLIINNLKETAATSDDKIVRMSYNSILALGELDPHLMLHIFLPPLIFESAASLEWHIFDKSKFYIMNLAGPGILIATSLTALILNNVLFNASWVEEEYANFADGYGCTFVHDGTEMKVWPKSAGMLLGVILSATDPVAVVALLKELGVKADLSTSIEGESLFNDGTALVIFNIVVKIVRGNYEDGVFEYLYSFVSMAFGGAIFGVIFGMVIVLWLSFIFNDALSEITITMAAAYLCFFVAEEFLHMSGVIAVVCFGLYFGKFGKTRVSPEVSEFLEEFWELLAYVV